MRSQEQLPHGVVIGEGRYSDHVVALLQEHASDACGVKRFSTTNDLIAALADDAEFSGSNQSQLAFVVAMVGDDTPTADDILKPLGDLPAMRNARLMVMCTSLEIGGVQWLTDTGRLDWVGYAPELQVDAFIDDINAQLVRFKEHQKPESTFHVSSLFDQPYSDSVIIGMILRDIELALGPQPRIKLPSGVRLTIKGEWVEEVTIILDGRVALIHDSPGGDEIVMHEESTGRIIGLLAVSEGRRALLNAVTTTDVTGVRLTVEQLNSAIQGHPDITLLVATLFIRSLDRRLRRAEALHIQNVELSEQLEAETEQLVTALSNLEEARTELSAQERLVSLGSLSAGIAHELNNPMAAIQRISQYLREDVSRLLGSAPDKKWSKMALAALSNGADAPALSSKAYRQLRRDLTEATGDAGVAQRLSLAGIQDVGLAKQLGKKSVLTVEAAEQAASIGTSLRNLGSASIRISELVSSLRSYARPDADHTSDIDVNQNLDDAIRLLSHKLDRIELSRKYKDLPQIEGHPGQLAQVWTNLLTNAAEAIADAADKAQSEEGAQSRGAATPEPTAVSGPSTATGSFPSIGSNAHAVGSIKILTTTPKPGWVRVEIKDDGPGIPEAILPHVFEPRFTTKSGQVRFGMGIGLGVTRAVVGRHHGTMRICTSPDGTTVVVDLPVRAPKE